LSGIGGINVKTGVSILAMALAGLISSAAQAEDIAVLTPYISSVATNEIVETFKKDAAGKGWNVNVVDTRGDLHQCERGRGRSPRGAPHTAHAWHGPRSPAWDEDGSAQAQRRWSRR
jgi:hypothetical protein